jgi:hypothetical protein
MGGVEQRLFDAYAPFGVKRGSELYLPLSRAKTMVEECRRERVAVIGVDFVTIDGGQVRPSMPINSADWSSFLASSSWDEIVTRCNAASLVVLDREGREGPEQLCSMALLTEDEWKRGD